MTTELWICSKGSSGLWGACFSIFFFSSCSNDEASVGSSVTQARRSLRLSVWSVGSRPSVYTSLHQDLLIYLFQNSTIPSSDLIPVICINEAPAAKDDIMATHPLPARPKSICFTFPCVKTPSVCKSVARVKLKNLQMDTEHTHTDIAIIKWLIVQCAVCNVRTACTTSLLVLISFYTLSGFVFIACM